MIITWAGVRLFITSSDSARVRAVEEGVGDLDRDVGLQQGRPHVLERVVDLLGVQLARDRSFLNVPSSFVVSVSNMGSSLGVRGIGRGAGTGIHPRRASHLRPRTSSTAWRRAIGLNGFVK